MQWMKKKHRFPKKRCKHHCKIFFGPGLNPAHGKFNLFSSENYRSVKILAKY
jgi:hypothetical protein